MHIQSRLIVTLMQLSGRDIWSADMRCRMNAVCSDLVTAAWPAE